MTDRPDIKINSDSLAYAIADWMVKEYTEWRDDDPNNPTIDCDAPPPTLYQLARELAATISGEAKEGDIEHL